MSVSFSPSRSVSGRNVVAVLGPTNTGKTHLAIERMLGHETGVIGLPLRLLAREVYTKVAARVGSDQVALITGEEKIQPPAARYRVCTVEAMPAETDAAFLAIDEIQLAGQVERGHVFTDRMLNLRGTQETLLLGAATMRGIVERLIPGTNVVTRPRMSVLSYAGEKKITRLPRRSAVVAFSSDEVYAIAELIRRQRGGAAVVLGALSPRTRNAQVELYQAGDVDFLVATDAIGMGLNLDLDHVAFAADQKFDGFQYRRLTPAELGQIAGRAGRHMRDGTFGVTSRVVPLDDGLVEALETHQFDPVKTVQWRNRDLDFANPKALKASLDMVPTVDGLTKAPPADDATALEAALRSPEIEELADTPERVAMLWDVCQVPDYRKIAPANHAELVTTLFGYLARDGQIRDDWFASQVAFADRIDGDIDTLSNRIAHIRTWTFAANRPQWLADPGHWQERTRAIEDRLSDALHERLMQRFVDRRTSVLMRRLRENAMLEAEVTAAGDVMVEGQHVGHLHGFRFAPDPSADGPDGKALKAAAQKALASEISARAERLSTAAPEALILSADGQLRWQGETVARLVESDDALAPRLLLLADDLLAGAMREHVQNRLDRWLTHHANTLLKPLIDLRTDETLPGPARGLAFRLVENFGVVERSTVAEEVRNLDQDVRAELRRHGVRFGAYHLFVPQLLKPAPVALLALCWGLKNSGIDRPGVAELPQISGAGRTTIEVDPAIDPALYRVGGYTITGQRAIRLDILERLADQIRPLLAWRRKGDETPPEGAVDGRCFMATGAMTSLTGCSGEDFAALLRSIGYRSERRPAPPKPAAQVSPTDGEADPSVPEASEAAPDRPLDGAAGADVPPVVDGAPAEAPADLAAETVPTDAAAEATTPAELPANPPGDGAAEAPPPVAAAVGETTADTDGAPEPTDDIAEPAFVEVWFPVRQRRPGSDSRPNRRSRRGQGQDRPTDGAAGSDQAGSGDGAAGRGDRRGRPSRRPRSKGAPGKGPKSGRQAPPQRRERAERPADPDSPFAALAALKADLEAKNRTE